MCNAAGVLAAVAAAFPAGAQAQDAELPVASLSNGTVGAGANVFVGQLGWPGVSLGFVHGFGDAVDVGIKADLFYAVEGMLTIVQNSAPDQRGFGARIPLRILLSRSDRASFVFHVEPGVKLYTSAEQNRYFFGTPDPGGWFGVQAPIGFTIGYAPTQRSTIGFGVDAPMTVFVSPAPTSFWIAPRAGPQFEVHMGHATVGVIGRVGVALRSSIPGTPRLPNGTQSASGGGEPSFLLQALLGYRL